MHTNTFFLPYQKRWITDTSQIKIMEKSRQIGISWATAYALVRTVSQDTQRYDAWVSSRDSIQAKLFLNDCKAFSNILNLAATELNTPIIEASKRTCAYTLEFKNKVRIHSLSSNPNAQAGKRGSRILDEFALHVNPQELYSIAYPGITWGGQLEIISTHRGGANFFNQLLQEIRENGNPKNISVHRVTLEDALNQGFLTKLKTKLPLEDPRQAMDTSDYYNFVKASCPDEASFLQEYMCQPMDDAATFLSYELIQPCWYPAGDAWNVPISVPSRGNFYLGIDIARTGDLSVFWLLESIGSILYTRAAICVRNKTFSEQEAILWELMRTWQVQRVCIDQTGIGYQFAERAIERFGSSRVEGVHFTNEIKSVLAHQLRMVFEKRAIRIPNDTELLVDLRSIKKEPTATGGIRFCAQHTKDGHADRFWGLALAIHAAHITTTNSCYETLRNPLHLKRTLW